MLLCSLALVAPQAAPAAQPAVEDRLVPFAYKDVRLTGGPFADQAAYARRFYASLNEDSLLQGFRLRAGLPAPGSPMGGWYDPNGFAAAHPFGQYISALARYYANTGDPKYKAKVARLVHGLRETLGTDGFCYASRKVFREWPCYIYDKYCTAMRDAYQLTGNREAMTVLERMTDWAFVHLPRRSDEWYTLAENLYKCYALTGDKRYLVMAGEFDAGKEYYDEFASGKNAFHPDLHAYSHVNALSSIAMEYEATGNSRCFAALENSWKFLTTTQDFASGGWGPDERFVLPGSLGKTLNATKAHFETPCGTYATVNLDRYLLRFRGDSKYGDNMERVLVNGLLAALPPEPDGKTFYYSDYGPGARKVFFPDAWPCCSGTYAEGTADYPVDIYFHDAAGVYVNLFVPSKLAWSYRDGTIRIEQSTNFPESGHVSFKVSVRKPTTFNLSVRCPSWASGTHRVLVDGRPFTVEAHGGFLEIKRRWDSGDIASIDFPMSLRFEPIDVNTPERDALLYGPTLLVALSDTDVALDGDREHPERWINRVSGNGLEFRATSGVAFKPFYRISSERYTTYCRVGWAPNGVGGQRSGNF